MSARPPAWIKGEPPVIIVTACCCARYTPIPPTGRKIKIERRKKIKMGRKKEM